VECFKPADFPTLSVRDGNFTSSYDVRPTLVVEYGMCGRENIPFIDQGAAARNSNNPFQNKAIDDKAGRYRSGKRSITGLKFCEF
jgi:hypothetical protein